MPDNKADLYNDNKAKYNKADIADDRGFVNSNTDSSVVSKSDGNNVMAAGKYAQIKMDKEYGCTSLKCIGLQYLYHFLSQKRHNFPIRKENVQSLHLLVKM